MFRFIKSFFLTALLLLTAAGAYAEDVTFKINVELFATVGQPLRVEFTLNAVPDKGSFTAPSFDGFDVIAGPVESSGRSIQIINGNSTTSASHTTTYLLLPHNSGTFTIGAASVKVDGKRYSTHPTPVEVKDAGSTTTAQEQNGNENSQATDSNGQISGEDLFISLSFSRNNVYKGEAILATLNLYNRSALVDYALNKQPAFDDFWAHQLDPVRNIRRENYNGKVYEVYTIGNWLLYPQKSGQLTIEPVEMTATIQIQAPSTGGGFDPFSNMFNVYNIERKLATKRISVNVKDLPAGAPSSFSGAVGHFSIESALSASQLEANSSATYTLKISGKGNTSFIAAPKIEFPASFEKFPVKTSEEISYTGSGMSGTRIFEYSFIARADGTYTIPPVEFTYLNPESGQYVTISTGQPDTITVTPDTGSGNAAQVVSGAGLSREDVRELSNDIRFIKLDLPKFRKNIRPAIFSMGYFAVILGIVAMAIITYLLLLRQRRYRRDITLVRGKRANKVAVQRFRAAERHMKSGNRNGFYEEMLKALWGYISDKFNIPVANLTKEYVREELQKRGIASEEAYHFTAIISKCDEAQYSPSASVQMNDIYVEGINIVSHIETTIKK